MDETITRGLSQVESAIRAMQHLNVSTMNLVSNTLTDGLKGWLEVSLPLVRRMSSRCRGTFSERAVICPPDDVCPPQCLMTITRHASVGEVIIVPFRIRNTGNAPKTYRLGVRPLLDDQGHSIAQPTLDRTEIHVLPGEVSQREMRLEIAKGFAPGGRYETDIVIRERSHNQNICFRLYTCPPNDVPEAVPIDEKALEMRFHQWYHHYYCRKESLRGAGKIEVDKKTEKDI